MSLQIIIVGAIVLLACLYLGKSVFGRLKSFSGKSACATDCGCSGKSNGKSSFDFIKQ